jgi:hypothetical protein
MATKEVKTKAPAKAKPKTKAVAVKPKSNAGRKTVLTEEVSEKILGSIRLGVPIKDAMKIQGLSENTYFKWMKRGADELDRLERDPKAIPNPSEVEFLQFLQSVERAKSEAAGLHVGVVANAAKNGDWRASAWWLERQRRDEFGKEPPITVVGTQNNVNINMTVTLAEVQRKLKEIMSEANVIAPDEQ